MLKMIVRLLLSCAFCVLASSEDTVQTFSVYQTPEKINSDGFPVEIHHVTTSDGYILEMHRIPHGRSTEDMDAARPVVFLMHGFTAASNSFIAIGPEYSLAYNLADAGFDVWMGNARGTKSSRYHISLDPDDNQEKFSFFDFSFDEIGRLDLPAMIDYVLEYTGKDKLHYIGHSQGGTVFLVLTSMLPDYNQKILSAHLLAGVGYMEYFPNTALVLLASQTDLIYRMATRMGIVELFPPNSTEMLPGGILPWPYTARTADHCTGDLSTRHMCELFGMEYIVRDGSSTDSSTDMPGASLKQLAHFGQNVRDKLFRRYHHGIFQNPTIYGTADPPLYDLSLITANVTMHYTVSDSLLDERDVLAMVADMPNAVARQVARTTFLHEDFIVALDSKELVTDYIIETIKNDQEYYNAENNQVNVVEVAATDAPSIDLPTDSVDDPTDSADDPTDSADDPTDSVDNPVNIVDASGLESVATDSATGLNAMINMCLLILGIYAILK